MKLKMERKYVVRRWVVGSIALFLLFWWLMDLTTPKQCQVPVSQMSQACLDLEFPR